MFKAPMIRLIPKTANVSKNKVFFYSLIVFLKKGRNILTCQYIYLLQYIFKRLPQDCRVLDNEIVSTLKEPLEVSVQTRTRGTLCRLLSKTNFPDDAEGPSFFKDWMASMMNERGIMGGKGGDHVPEEAPVQAIRRYDDSQAGTRGMEEKKKDERLRVRATSPPSHTPSQSLDLFNPPACDCVRLRCSRLHVC